MPDLPSIPATPPVGRQPTISPRQSLGVNLIENRANQEAAQRDIRSAQLSGQIAQNTSAIGGQLHRAGQEILDPFNQLAKAREITRANDIMVNSQIELNSRLQAIKSSGAQPEELLPLTQKAFDDISKTARAQSKKISPAATEFVENNLQQIKLSAFTHIQKEAFERDANQQLSSLQRLSTFSRQAFFLTDDPALRESTRNTLFSTLDMYAQTGLISPGASQKEKSDFDKFVATESGTQLAQTMGLPVAYQFIDENIILSPNEKVTAKHHAYSAVSASIKALEAEEKRLGKELKVSQQVISSQIRKTVLDPKTPITLLQGLFQQVPDLTAARALDGGDSEALLTLLDKVIDERTGPLKHDNEASFLRHKMDILFSPDGVNPNSIAQTEGLTIETKGQLLNDLSSVRNREHYTNSPVYKNLVAEIDAVVPKNMILQLPGKEQRNIELFIQRAITSFDRYISRSAGTDGILPDNDILKIGTPLKDQIIEELVKRKMPLSGRTIEELLLQESN